MLGCVIYSLARMSFRKTSYPDFETLGNGEYMTFLLDGPAVSYLQLKKNKFTFK